MKRIICLLLAMVMCVAMLAGCDQLGGGGGDTTETDETLENALTFLSSKYSTLEGTHVKDFDVVSQVIIRSSKYPVTWSADTDKVSVRPSTEANHTTVDLPDDNAEEFTFTLTATITSTNGVDTATKTFTIKVPGAASGNELSILEAIELGGAQGTSQYTSEKYYVSGTVKSITNETYGNLYITDGEGNDILIYGTYDASGKVRFDKMDTKPQVGDTVTFYGVVGNYNGTPQLKNAWLVKLNGEELGGGENVASGIILDMMGSTNIQSHSATQMIYSANGITLTNDKNTSTVDCYNNTGSYAARFYSGATIKIEYAGMTKIMLTLDDYSPEAGKDYLKGFDGMTVDGATIIRNNDIVTIYFSAPTDVFQSKALGSQTRVEQIEVFTGAVETPPAGDDSGSGSTESYTAPVVGQAYKFYIEQTSLGKTLYFAGTMDADKGTYLATTENVGAAVDIYFENTDGGYHIYFMSGETKTYINAAAYLKSNGYAGCHFELGASPICVWTYDTTYGILEVYGEVEGKYDTFFAGTYGSYGTISLSGAYYKDQIPSGSQFPARLLLSDGTGSVTPETPDTPDSGSTDSGSTDSGNEGTEAPVVSGSATVDFSDVSNRTSFDGTCQVWEQNGVKLTNNKSASTNAVADYSNPARFYKNSELVIDCTGMVKIEFICNSSSYANALVASITAADGVSVSSDGATVTVTFATAVNSFTVAALSGGQVRMNSLTVYTA